MHHTIHEIIKFNTDEFTLERLHEPFSSVTMTVTMSRLLQFLIEHHGNNVTKDDILSQVWEAHGLRASTHSMNKYISELRQMFRTLGVDDEVIVTIPRVGFSIPAAVTISSPVVEIRQDSLVLPELSAKKQNYFFKNYQIILLVTMIVFFLGTLFYVFQTDINHEEEDIYTAAQKTYPIGMIDDCPVVALNRLQKISSRGIWKLPGIF